MLQFDTTASVSALLHGFDVPACCVAYDGRATVMTSLAAWAHANRVNPVNPAYRSTTYGGACSNTSSAASRSGSRT